MRHYTQTVKIDAALSKMKQKQTQTLLHESIKDMAELILSEVSTLYVGNINEAVTEEVLAKVFGKFGNVCHIKLMFPRSESD